VEENEWDTYPSPCTKFEQGLHHLSWMCHSKDNSNGMCTHAGAGREAKRKTNVVVLGIGI
jgi:hypothetical protein